MNQDFGSHLRPFIGARVFTPLGPGVLVSVAEVYLVVKLEADGKRIRYHDDRAVLLYAGSVPNPVKQSCPDLL
jgi:hypothetical protein